MNTIWLKELLFICAMLSLEACINRGENSPNNYNPEVLITETNKQTKGYSSFAFIQDNCLRDSIISFIKETPKSLYDRPVKTTIQVDNTDNITEVSIFRMISFVYPMEETAEKELLGVSQCEDESIIYCRGIIPPFINVSLLDYDRGLDLLREDTNSILNNGLESVGYIRTLSMCSNNEWVMIEKRSIRVPDLP